MQQDHSPIRLNEFNGLFGTTWQYDAVPRDHFIDSLNTINNGTEVTSRGGVDRDITFPAILKVYYWRIQGEATRVIALNNIGQLFDLTVSDDDPILVIPLMSDFAASPFNNRLYISPHNGVSGLPGEFVYVYTGSGLARKAAGVAPSSGFTVSLGSAGHIPTGTHIFAWVFESTSGYVSPPGPVAFQTLVFDGLHKANFSVIPVGPAGTAKRRLLASRAIQTYDGNQNAYEMFFVPGGIINDNATTVLNDIDFYDADLQLSADYSFDQLSEIPAVLFLASYGRRMVYGSTDLDKNIVYISKDNEPESINSLAGFQSFDPHETEGVKDATEFRGNLYVMKRTKTYTGRDNTYEPSTWHFDSIDSSIGCDAGGVAKYIDSKGSKSDFFIVASPSGLFKFTGVYEEIPLSYKIKMLWGRINKLYMNKIQVLVHADMTRIYILVPIDGVISPNYIIMGDYEMGLNFQKIRWHLWNFQDFSPSSIAMDIDFLTKKTELKMSSMNGNVYSMNEDRTNDDGTAILAHVRFAHLWEVPNGIHHVGALGFRISGIGNIDIQLVGIDDQQTVVVPGFDMGVQSLGREFVRPAKFQDEKPSVLISIEEINSYFILNEIVVYMNLVFQSRPGS